MSVSANFCRAEDLALEHLPAKCTFALPVGGVTALIGPNGSGKTSLLRAMIGEAFPRAGTLEIDGTDVTRLSGRELSRKLAYVPQEQVFPPDLLTIDLLRLAFLPRVGLFKPLPPREAPEIIEAVEGFQLERLAMRTLDRLSTGERQRALLARAVLQRSEGLLLDEPTNHLDPGGRDRFWTSLERLVTSGTVKNVVLSTHDLEWVASRCDRVLALWKNGVFFCGPAGEFFSSDWRRLYAD